MANPFTVLQYDGENSLLQYHDGGVFHTIPTGGTPAWGDITGTLSNQTDLQTALNSKAPIDSPTFTTLATINGDGVTSAGQLKIAAQATGGTPLISATTVDGTGSLADIIVAPEGAIIISGNVSGGSISLTADTAAANHNTFQVSSDGTIIPPILSADPVAPATGAIWFNNDLVAWRGYDGSDFGTFTFTPDA